MQIHIKRFSEISHCVKLGKSTLYIDTKLKKCFITFIVHYIITYIVVFVTLIILF